MNTRDEILGRRTLTNIFEIDLKKSKMRFNYMKIKKQNKILATLFTWAQFCRKNNDFFSGKLINRYLAMYRFCHKNFSKNTGIPVTFQI